MWPVGVALAVRVKGYKEICPGIAATLAAYIVRMSMAPMHLKIFSFFTPSEA